MVSSWTIPDLFTPGIVTSTRCALSIPLRRLLSDMSTLSASPQCLLDKVDTLSPQSEHLCSSSRPSQAIQLQVKSIYGVKYKEEKRPVNVAEEAVISPISPKAKVKEEGEIGSS